MNILIPFDTPNTRALTQALSAVARGEFTCITDFDEVSLDYNPASRRATHDIVLVDLDASNMHAEEALAVMQGVRTTMSRLEQLTEYHLFKAVDEEYRFVFFSKALVNGLASAETESFNPLQEFLEEMTLHAVNQKLLQPKDEAGLLILEPWNVIDMARSLALMANDLSVSHTALNQTETPAMISPSPRLTPSAKIKLNNVLPSAEGLRFSCDEQVMVYTYSDKPGALRQRLDLLTLPVSEFFEPFKWTTDLVLLLTSFVLVCPDKESLPGDAFDGAFNKFLQTKADEKRKVLEVAPGHVQAPKPNTYSRWNSPENDSGLTNAMRSPPATQATANPSFTNGRLTAPEDVPAIKAKYAALMVHLEHVKHWVKLFTHLSAEDQVTKDLIFKEMALPNRLEAAVCVTLKFSVKNLFTDQFLAAKQDGAYLGVSLTVKPQTELEFVSIYCSFKFD